MHEHVILIKWIVQKLPCFYSAYFIQSPLKLFPDYATAASDGSNKNLTPTYSTFKNKVNKSTVNLGDFGTIALEI